MTLDAIAQQQIVIEDTKERTLRLKCAVIVIAVFTVSLGCVRRPWVSSANVFIIVSADRPLRAVLSTA